MKTSRQRLLAYIRTQQVVTIQDLSRALLMTPANARHHLTILQEQGLIEPAGQRYPKGRGRPAQLYRLSQHAAGDNLDRLSHILLEELFGGLDDEGRDQALQVVAQHLIALVGARKSSNKTPLPQRLFEAVQSLNALHYHARWEAHAGAPRVILGHCPYLAILPEHPEMCLIDAYLLESLLEISAVQKTKQAADLRGVKSCIFELGKRE